MEEKAGMFADIEKVKALSSLIGGQPEGGQMDIASMMEMAKKMNAMMNLFGANQSEQTPKPEIKAETKPEVRLDFKEPDTETEPVEVFENSREKVIHAAIPFLDQEYQKDLYIIVRLLEMRRVMSQPDALLESRSRGVKTIDTAQRRRQLLQAVRPYLNAGERSRVDQMAKLMEVRQIMDRKDG